MRVAACWTVVTTDGRFGFVTNGGTGDVTGLAIAQDGSISLLDPSGVLYARNASLAKIDAFRIGGDGSLTWVGGVSGLPASAAGLASS